MSTPEWAEQPPDPATIEAGVRREMAHLNRDYDVAAHNAAYFRPVVRASLLAVAFPVIMGGFIALAYVLTGFDASVLVEESSGEAAALEPSPFLLLAVVIALFGPWFAASAIYRRRRLGQKRPGFFLVGFGLWLLALALSCFTLGLSFLLLPLVVGLLTAVTRPTVFHADRGTVGKAPASSISMWLNARRAAAAARAALRGTEARVREEVSRRHQEHLARYEAHQRELAAHVPFQVVALPEVQDLLVVGGAPAERGDLLHHLGAAAASHQSAIWVLDLESRGVPGRLLAEATIRQQPVGMLTATDEPAVARLLDDLDGLAARRSSALVEVLAAALAQDAEARVVSRARETADILRRIESHLRPLAGGMTLVRLHAALEALLSGREAAAGHAGPDDFGLADPASAPLAGAALPAEVVAKIRNSFSQQDRQHFYPVWTDLRIKLETLLPAPGQQDTPNGWAPAWSAHAAGNIVVVPTTLARADRELRISLLVAHHLQLLKGNGPKPRVLVVIGAAQAPPELLTELSEVAAAAQVLLVPMFTELTNAVEELALGRRHVAVFGGHGAQAAERLAELFGKDWVDRLQSYQRSWSQAETESRAETEGRNWSRSSTVTDSRNRSWSTGSSNANGDGDSSHSRSSSHGYSRSRSEGEQSGQSFSQSYTSGSTDTQGGAETTTREYDRRITGAQIGALPPFTMLLKRSGSVHVVDVKADLVLPPTVTESEPAVEALPQ